MFRDTRGSWSRREEKNTERKIDERPVPTRASSTCPRLHNNNEECVFRIPSTARLAILHYIPRRRSERSPWNLCVEIGYWIYPIGFRSIVSLNIGWWMAIICFFFFFPVCVYGNEGFFRFGIVVERPEIFFSFEDLLWKIYSKSFLFFCLYGKWIFFFFSFCAVKSVGEKSCIEIYGIFLSCFWIVVLYNIPCSLSSEREILLLFFSLDNRYGWLYL